MQTSLLKTGAPSQLAFPAGSCNFLQQLAQNNCTTWFADHRRDYQSQLVEPLKALIASLQTALLELDAGLDVSYRVNTTVMRINRDRRFNPTAAPYREYVKVSFPQEGRKWSNDPVLGFGVFPDYFYVAFRNAGKSRAEFVERYEKNLQEHRELLQHWLDRFDIARHLQVLGGAHDQIEPLGPCSSQAVDWIAEPQATVGFFWPRTAIDTGRCTFNDIRDQLARLYFLKMMALYQDPARRAPAYFQRVATICAL